MNDWYNTNEHRSYPFIENHSDSLPTCEIVDCKFFLLNADDTKVYLASRTEGTNSETGKEEITYVFRTSVGNIELTVEKSPEYKVVKFNEDFAYGVVVFGDTTN